MDIGDRAIGEADQGVQPVMRPHTLAFLSQSDRQKSQADIGSFVLRNGSGPCVAEPGTRALLLVVPTLSDPHCRELLKVIEHEARRSAFSLIAAQSDYSSVAESQMLAAAAHDVVTRGTVVVPTAVAAATSGAGAFAAAAKPLVYLGRWPASEAPVADSIGPHLPTGRTTGDQPTAGTQPPPHRLCRSRIRPAGPALAG